jgi:hypothetical protein
MFLAPLLVVFLVPTIWIVDAANGPGTNFTDLPAAVAAAASGDTIIVRSGTYSAFHASGKSLTIRGAGFTTTTVSNPPPPGSPYQQTTIENVPAGTPFFIDGLQLSPPAPWVTGQINAAIQALGSSTVVVLADVKAQGISGQDLSLPTGTPGLYLAGGARVHATRCLFYGGHAFTFQAGVGAWVTNGCVLAADASTFVGGGGYLAYSAGGAGLRVQGGLATLTRSSVYGGNANFGGNGLFVDAGGFARVAGTPQDILASGTGFPGNFAVFAAGDSSIAIHGAVSIQAGPPGGATIVGPVTTGGVALPYLSMTGSATTAGELLAAQPVTAIFEGVIPNAPFACIADVAPGFSTAYAPPNVGELLVRFPLGLMVEGTLSATGTFQIGFTPAVNAPFLTDLPVYLQFGVVDTVAGQVRLSNGCVRVFSN